jgi:hypothetical protein
MVQAIPAISVMIGMLFTLKSFEQTLVIIPLTLAALTPVYYNFWRYETLPYYKNFIHFATNKISKEEYFSTFGGNVLRNYKTAKTIVSLTDRDDRIFIWGDSSAVYALSRRLPPIKYVADYHIKDFSSNDEVIEKVEVSEPKLIIILPDAPNFPALLNFLDKNYIQIESIDGVQIWKLQTPSVRALLAP